MKRILSILLSLCMLVSLAACAADPTPETDEPSSSDTVAEIEYMPDIFSELRPKEDFAEVGENVVPDGSFEGDKILWTLYEESGGDAELFITEENTFETRIQDGGSVSHAVQIYYDGVKLHQYAKYEFSFDAWSTIPGKILEARIQYNGGDYHAYCIDFPVLSDTPTTYTIAFEMEAGTDIAPRVCFNMGRALDGSEADADLTNYSIFLDNLSVVCTDNSRVVIEETDDLSSKININQVGYLPDSPKTAIFYGEAIVDTFDVLDKDGNVVYTGDITGPVENMNALEYNWYGDFSSVTEPGVYTISAKEYGKSYPFEIGENVFDKAFKDVVNMFYMQRCGCELPAEFAGEFAHAECHNTPARIYGTDTFIDVNGGWHDAGDYGRYVVPAAKTVADLLLAYDANPDAFGDDCNVPESGNGVPDILDEIRYELEWMLKMQDTESGGVYHKVTCADFPGNVMPEEETEELIVCPITKNATYDFAAAMAMAYRYYNDIDADFAQTCLDAALKAWDYTLDCGFVASFSNPIDPATGELTITTGEYGDKVFTDEMFWAAAELFAVTGDDSYQEVIDNRMKIMVHYGLGWADVGTYGIITYLNIDESKTTPETRQLLLDGIIAQADKIAHDSSLDGYHISLGSIGYVWGSNMSVANNAMTMLLVNDIQPNEDYTYYAGEHINYLFGANPVSYCYITGNGSVSPTGTHHRPSIALGTTMPGMLVGGPNDNLEDPYALSALSTQAPARCYVDNVNAYSLNEITIYWNSPLVYLMARLCK